MFNQTYFFGLLKAADDCVLTMQEYVAQHGMGREDILPHVTEYVAKEGKYGTRIGQNGLTFKPASNTAEFKKADARRTYLMGLIFRIPKAAKDTKRGAVDKKQAFAAWASKLDTSDIKLRIRALERELAKR